MRVENHDKPFEDSLGIYPPVVPARVYVQKRPPTTTLACELLFGLKAELGCLFVLVNVKPVNFSRSFGLSPLGG